MVDRKKFILGIRKCVPAVVQLTLQDGNPLFPRALCLKRFFLGQLQQLVMTAYILYDKIFKAVASFPVLKLKILLKVSK